MTLNTEETNRRKAVTFPTYFAPCWWPCGAYLIRTSAGTFPASSAGDAAGDDADGGDGGAARRPTAGA